MSETEHPASAIARVFFGDDFPEERAVLERKIAATSEGDVWLDLLSRVRDIERQYPYQGDLNEFRRYVYNAIGEAEDAGKADEPVRTVFDESSPKLHPPLRTSSWGKGRPVGQPFSRRVWFGVTGLAIGLVGLLIGWGTHIPQFMRSPQHAMLTYTTLPGQRANITLPDGSTVVLNVASRLDVPADYLAGNHALRLSGEAFFTVRHNTDEPFVVTSGTDTARVLGTGFLVRHYPTDTVTTIAVRDGKVAVRTHVLSASQQGAFGARDMVRIHAAHPSQFAFVTGVLSLDNIPLGQAIVELGRWYNLDIRLGDPQLAERRIDAGFTAGASSDLIAILEGTVNIRVVRAGRVWTLYPRDGK